MAKKIIILDTNFLIGIVQARIDLQSELKELCPFRFDLKIIDKTFDELDKIDNINSRIAKEIINKNDISKIPSSDNYVDDEIVKIADKDTIVATQDKELKKRLQKKKIPIMIIRQRKYLRIEGL